MGLSGGGGRAARALRLLLLAVMALAAVEYLFGSILETSSLKTYLYSGAQTTARVAEKQYSSLSWPKKFPVSYQTQPPKISLPNTTTTHNTTIHPSNIMLVSNTSTTYNNITINSIIETLKNHSNPLMIRKIISSLESFNAESSQPDVSKAANVTQTPKAKTEAPVPGNAPKKEVVEESVESSRKSTTNAPGLPACETPQDLGPIVVNKSDLALDSVERRFPDVRWGGSYAPPDCEPQHRVAIIVPFRDRQQHLTIFLNHMHKFLRTQKIEYGIFIIEQEDSAAFNRAKLMNVGFVESQKMRRGGWQCFIFHDVDLLPQDTRNLYTCPRQPRHMSAAINTFNYKLPYETIFGGVSALTAEQFTKVNGFSNQFWGWGGEDDDMSLRLKKNNYHIARYKMSIARYTMLEHKKSLPNPKRYQVLKQSRGSTRDGLSNLKYELVEVCQNQLYTHIVADIREKS